MKLSELKADMDRQFEQVDERFTRIDRRFEDVDKRFEQVDVQFAELSWQITAEGEKTRRHFDVAVEQIKAERNLVLDQSIAVSQRLEQHVKEDAAGHALMDTRLNDHQRRIAGLESKAGTDLH